MKSKFLFSSVLLTTCLLTSCGLIKKEVDDPTKPTYYTLTISAGEGGTVNSNVNGQYEEGAEVKIIATANSGWQFSKWSDGDIRATRTLTMNKDYVLTASFEKKPSEPTETVYYIKHPWGTGLDSSWEWVQMTKVGSNYEYENLWGGVGANINTAPSDTGADWFPESAISGADALSIGDGVKFTYNPSNATLTATKTSSASSNKAQVRFLKVFAYDLITKLGIADKSENIIVYYEFGSGTGTSPYYEIPASSLVPEMYWLKDGDDPEGWYSLGDSNNNVWTYNFEAGKKYTFSLEEDSAFINIDGAANAPAKIVSKNRGIKLVKK